LGRRKAYGYTFVSWESDHPPLHVHVYDRRDREVGRWDIEGQRPMDDFPMTRNLKKALLSLGYLYEEL
jgi:hypothetical protein